MHKSSSENDTNLQKFIFLYSNQFRTKPDISLHSYMNTDFQINCNQRCFMLLNFFE